jgi:hypothetical protein
MVREDAAAVLEEHGHLARAAQQLDHALAELGVLDAITGRVRIGHLVDPDRAREVGLDQRLVV